MKYKVKKSFIERNGKIRKKNDIVDMVDVVAEFYEKNGYIEKIDDKTKDSEADKVVSKGTKKNAKKNP